MAGAPHPKTHIFRSRRLLDLAAECPCCMSCGGGRAGEMVGCHSNALEDGHGAGLKAHDLTAFCCRRCHDIIDGRRSADAPLLSHQERAAMFYRAYYRTTVWLFQAGHLQVVA